jgi:hypothetical protein
MYYAKVLDLWLHKQHVLDSLCNKAIKNVRKEHMTHFHKRLLVCDPTLGPKFFK